MTVDEMYDILQPRIEDAYRQTAPRRPAISCYVAVPFPHDIFDVKADGDDLIAHIKASTDVLDAEIAQRYSTRFDGYPPIRLYASKERPTVVVLYRPYAEMQGDRDATSA